jgi:hypothetical protein
MTTDGSTRLASRVNVSMRTAEERALDFAEDLGRLLGTAERKANDWLAQRREVTKQLTELRDKATQLLERIGGDAPFPIGRRRSPGRPRKAAVPSADMPAAGTTKSRTRKPMSAAARKAVGERMRKYWAGRKRAEKRS